MGHYDSRPGYCPNCGAAPGNIYDGQCQLCHKFIQPRETRFLAPRIVAPQPPMDLEDDTPLVCPMRKDEDDGPCEGCQ